MGEEQEGALGKNTTKKIPKNERNKKGNTCDEKEKETKTLGGKMDFNAHNGEGYYEKMTNEPRPPDKRDVVWLGVIPQGGEDKYRYPTEEEVDEMLKQQMEGEDGDV